MLPGDPRGKGWLWDQTTHLASFLLPPPHSWSKAFLIPMSTSWQQNHTEQRLSIHQETWQNKAGARQVTVGFLGQMSWRPKSGGGDEGVNPGDITFASCAIGFMMESRTKDYVRGKRWLKWRKPLISNTNCDGFKICPWILCYLSL